ncbi:glycosyltransferase family 4 protein [Butyrivibrio sp. NC2007]|uniref:glycosyltransferase family 4 protein n=1 Tax=Butyrivibrio sp. NC2007 TaxID=1280683 RepID=UPI0003B3B26F|nr:glycosyltransferase family 4 protein [Butyrivibrio sp. NC2007]
MRVLNLLTSGEAGGIESLCRDIGINSEYENGFCFLFSEGAIYDQMNELGLKTYSLAGAKNKLSKFSIKKLRLLSKIARDYDIICVHHGEPFLKLYGMLVKLITGKKMVTVAHSCFDRRFFFPNNKIKFHFAHLIFALGLNYSDLIIFVSNAGKEAYEKEFGLKNKRKAVVYNGISTDKLLRGRDNVVPVTKPYKITYIGRLKNVKGVDYLIRAIARIKNDYPISVSIVGDGPERDNLEELSNDIGVRDIVSFEGRHTDVIPFLENTSVFVYPSVWKEVFGISLVEAMAFGIPCVASDVGGIPEVVHDGKTGFLTSEANDEALAEALRHALDILDDEKLLEKISQDAKKKAADFSITNTCKRLKEEYSGVVVG